MSTIGIDLGGSKVYAVRLVNGETVDSTRTVVGRSVTTIDAIVSDQTLDRRRNEFGFVGRRQRLTFVTVAGLLGWMIWDQVPEQTAVLGAVLIISGGIGSVYLGREQDTVPVSPLDK